MKLEIRPITPSDYPAIDRMLLRKCDYNEIAASDPSKSVPDIVKMCARLPHTEIGLIDGKPMGMVGSVPEPQNPKFGIIWSFGSNEAYDHMDWLTSFAKAKVQEWLKEFPAGIGNWIDTRNTMNIKWLQGLGFTILPEEVDLGCGVPFKFFVRYPSV